MEALTAITPGPATIESGRAFGKSGAGRWAGERFMKALLAGKPLSPAALRTNELLMHEEWIFFDQQVVEEALIRLRGVADLIAAGLDRRIPNGLAKTLLMYQNIGDMDDAIVSMDGVTREENDRMEFGEASLPLPITHKDWYLNLRTLAASRLSGEPLDATYARVAGRKVGEAAENMLFNGGKQFAGYTIYGYTTHPNRTTIGFPGGESWENAGKTGEERLADVQTMLSAMEAKRQYGPYILYVPADASIPLTGDFKAASDKSTMERLLEIPQLQDIRVADKLGSGNLVLVQLAQDTVQWVIGEDLQNVQWDVHGGFQINFKAFQIGVPLIKADADGRTGIVHMNGTA